MIFLKLCHYYYDFLVLYATLTAYRVRNCNFRGWSLYSSTVSRKWHSLPRSLVLQYANRNLSTIYLHRNEGKCEQLLDSRTVWSKLWSQSLPRRLQLIKVYVVLYWSTLHENIVEESVCNTSGRPFTGVDGRPQTCSATSQVNTCPSGYWCHTGADQTTTVCCPGGKIYLSYKCSIIWNYFYIKMRFFSTLVISTS